MFINNSAAVPEVPDKHSGRLTSYSEVGVPVPVLQRELVLSNGVLLSEMVNLQAGRENPKIIRGTRPRLNLMPQKRAWRPSASRRTTILSAARRPPVWYIARNRTPPR